MASLIASSRSRSTPAFRWLALRPRNLLRRAYHDRAGPRQYKVTLDGDAVYIEQELAEALGWREGALTEGIPLRLSGWSPHYFAITQKGTDAG
jgi:hypothetical protein